MRIVAVSIFCRPEVLPNAAFDIVRVFALALCTGVVWTDLKKMHEAVRATKARRLIAVFPCRRVTCLKRFSLLIICSTWGLSR